MTFPVQLNRLILFSIMMIIMIMPLYHHELRGVTTSIFSSVERKIF